MRIATGMSKRARRVQELAEYRVEVDGRLVSQHPNCTHGTRNGYNYYSCGCEECSEAERTYRHELASEPVPQHLHGTVTGNANRRCQCPDCVTTRKRYDAQRYEAEPMNRLNEQQRARRLGKAVQGETPRAQSSG